MRLGLQGTARWPFQLDHLSGPVGHKIKVGSGVVKPSWVKKISLLKVLLKAVGIYDSSCLKGVLEEKLGNHMRW